MSKDDEQINSLIGRPQESLSIELKRWIDPDQPDGICKMVRAALALRNNNGGYLVIGFDNETLLPDQNNIPADVRSIFNKDKIQGLISKYSSELFEIDIEYPEREKQLYPVIIIPSGVKQPVACKSDLIHEGNKLLAVDAVYVRTLESNNTPSTSIVKWKDWPKVIDICFDNREADIGRFIRRHLSALALPEVQSVLTALFTGTNQKKTIEQIMSDFIGYCDSRYEVVRREKAVELPDFGTWEVALIILGEVPQYHSNKEFLNLIASANPNYTGWPIWLDTRSFHESERPYVNSNTWETYAASRMSILSHVDFMIYDPLGRFYLRRALQDDLREGRNAPEPFKELDFGLAILRTAEAMAVGMAFAKAMRCEIDKTTLYFSFKWTRLQGRELSSWANYDRYMNSGKISYQDLFEQRVQIPLETPLSAIGDYVSKVVNPLFNIFDGFSLSNQIIDEMIEKHFSRKR
ncbi:MAG: ATP-binding protein [Candidatus Edwardsbacteria bacterium]|nr:ATP-binding protein [Candidatus Edwardsbacteria bacterium]